MSARDELARDIFIADNSAHPNAGAEWDAFEDIGGVCGGDYAYGIADGLLAAGYRKPRTITTVEEVSALPNGSQIQDADPALCEKVNGRWYMPGSDYDYGDIHITLPATVLHEPEAEATQ